MEGYAYPSFYKEMNEAKTQNAVRVAQMRHKGSRESRFDHRPCGNESCHENPIAAGLMPLQMQGMGMPMSLPFLSAQSGMTNQMIMPMSNRMGMQMAIPSQIQMVHGLTAGMGVQVHPVTNSKDDADLSKKTSSHGQDANIPLGRSYSSKKDHE